MKRCFLVTLIVSFILVVLTILGYRHFILETRTYDIKSLSSMEAAELPIQTAHTAALYALQSDKYELPEYTKDSDWRFRTERVFSAYNNKKIWRVTLYSTYMPRYLCIMEFASHGEWFIENTCFQNGK